MICKGIKKNGEKCNNKAKEKDYCLLHKKQSIPIKSCITITFGDVAENHVRMQKLGVEAEEGFTLEDLLKAQSFFHEKNCETNLCYLNEYYKKTDNTIKTDDAYILIVRNACNILLEDMISNSKNLQDKLNLLKWDTKAIMYGNVVNKKARHNLCFAEEAQEPNIEEGKGTVVSFKSLEEINHIRNKIKDIIGEAGTDLLAEGNLYYDITKCGIGYHGDAERKKVIAIRLGESLTLSYQWYYKSKRIGEKCKFSLDHGDLYIMSAKAVGNDWKKKNILTLRHAAGCDKYTK